MELVLLNPILNPVVAHINGFRPFGAHSVVGNTSSSGIVGLNECGAYQRSQKLGWRSPAVFFLAGFLALRPGRYRSFWLRFWSKAESFISNQVFGVKLIDKRMETLFQRIIRGDNTGMGVDNDTPCRTAIWVLR